MAKLKLHRITDDGEWEGAGGPEDFDDGSAPYLATAKVANDWPETEITEYGNEVSVVVSGFGVSVMGVDGGFIYAEPDRRAAITLAKKISVPVSAKQLVKLGFEENNLDDDWEDNMYGADESIDNVIDKLLGEET